MSKAVCALIICLSVALSGCSSWKTPAEVSGQEPPIYPDYVGVTVPVNIAPLNFMIEGASRIQASFIHEGNVLMDIAGNDGVLEIPIEKWRSLAASVSGGSMDVEVSAWTDEFPEGVGYQSITINVAEDVIDPWIAYRLIEPGYVGWRELGLLYQRELSSFDEVTIVPDRRTDNTCMNCHHFSSYSSDRMMFHARGENGGTIFYRDGKLSKVDFKSIGPKMSTTYPAWHPEGKFMAFSCNTTRQVFYGEGEQAVEVYDDASDMLVYNIETGEVLTDPRFLTAEIMESFPSWSPDGDWLYYVAADVKKLPDDVKDLHYHLLRVPFDSETGTFGAVIDTLYNAHERGGSISHPRVSPDGKYLLYTWAGYGTFPIWHRDADLRMMDLQTMEDVNISVLNADFADSYHSWSSNGRWVMFGSRRLDGRHTRVYIGYFDEDGRVHKPFLLPQENPHQNRWRMQSYNVPEFMDGKIELPDDVADLFYVED